MRIEQIEISVSRADETIYLTQDDRGQGEMVIFIPIHQWEYVKSVVEKEIQEINEK